MFIPATIILHSCKRYPNVIMSESKEADPQLDAEIVGEVPAVAEPDGKDGKVEDDSGDEVDEAVSASVKDGNVAATSKSKKKKSKRARLKKALGAKVEDETADGPTNPASKLTAEMVEQLLEMNPSLKGEVAGMDKEKAAETLKKLDVADLLTGMSVSGKNQKDMASYKFWQTQPVPRFDETQKIEEGPIKIIDPEQVSKDPRALPDNYEWITMDLTDQKELEEVCELLAGHFVEDDDGKFRLKYSMSILNWALKSPGWRKDWHIGVRATTSRKLVAFISGVPVALRVRSKVLRSTEINFLCVHKKLRAKRLAPVLIEEITRRCYLQGVFQALYTGGVVLPKPVSSCRYLHRSLDWQKLYEVGFSPLPPKSTPYRQIARNHLPTTTSVVGLRPMEKKDIGQMTKLLKRYLKRFAMAPEFSEAEVEHWLLHDEASALEQAIWTYVAEDPRTNRVTDFFSFYVLESAVIGNPKYNKIRAAYLFYYATEAAFEKEEKGLRDRMNTLMLDALILAKRVCSYTITTIVLRF